MPKKKAQQSKGSGQNVSSHEQSVNTDKVKKVRIISKDSTYDEKACDEVIEILANNGSPPIFCAKYKISLRTYYRWINSYPEFAEAVDIGMTALMAYRTKMAEQNMENPDFNVTLFKFMNTNLFGEARKRRLPKEFYNPRCVMDSLKNAIARSDNGMVDIDELQGIVKSLSDIGIMKSNVELQDKVEALEREINARKGEVE